LILVEVIDITGSGNNILKLNLDELLDASTSTNILKVVMNKKNPNKSVQTAF
jgi:phosphotransferase system IIA component